MRWFTSCFRKMFLLMGCILCTKRTALRFTGVFIIMARPPAYAMIIVGAVFEIIAWGQLKRFFDSNLAMFPEDIGKSAKTGSFLCQLGAIFNITFILAPVGAILKVVGYFMLFKLKKL